MTTYEENARNIEELMRPLSEDRADQVPGIAEIFDTVTSSRKIGRKALQLDHNSLEFYHNIGNNIRDICKGAQKIGEEGGNVSLYIQNKTRKLTKDYENKVDKPALDFIFLASEKIVGLFNETKDYQNSIKKLEEELEEFEERLGVYKRKAKTLDELGSALDDYTPPAMRKIDKDRFKKLRDKLR